MAPVAHEAHQRFQRAPQIGERILHFRRHLAIDLAADQAIALQFAQVQGQHALRGARQAAAQLIEPPGAIQQLEQDDQLPATVDHRQRGLHAAWLRGALARQREQHIRILLRHRTLLGSLCDTIGTDLCVLVAGAGDLDMRLHERQARSAALVDAAGDPYRFVPVVPRLLHRQHCAARHPRRSRREPAQLQLVVAGYGIGFAVSLITGGRLGDICDGGACSSPGLPAYAGFGALRRRAERAGADCFARRAGGSGGNADAAGAGDHPHGVRPGRTPGRHWSLRHIDGTGVDRRTGGGRSVGQRRPVRLVVAADLFDQYPDRRRRVLPRAAHAARVAQHGETDPRSARRRADFGWPVPAGLSAGRGPRTGLADMVVRNAGRVSVSAVWFHSIRATCHPRRPHAARRAAPAAHFRDRLRPGRLGGILHRFGSVLRRADRGAADRARLLGICRRYDVPAVRRRLLRRLRGIRPGRGASRRADRQSGHCADGAVAGVSHRAAIGRRVRAGGAVRALRRGPGFRAAGVDQHRGGCPRRCRRGRGRSGRSVPDHCAVVHRTRRRGDRRCVLCPSGGGADPGGATSPPCGSRCRAT